MKKDFNQYVKEPLVLFLIALVLFIFSIFKGISSFNGQHYVYFSVYALMFFMAVIFLSLGIHWCRFDHKERRKNKQDKKDL